MKIRYQCSNCGQRFQTSAMVGVPNGMYLCGCRVVGDAFYCEECVKTWAERNGAEFDKQYKDPVGMFTKWWNRMVDNQAKSEGKTVKRYHVLPNGDYAGMSELKPCPFCCGQAELDFAHTSFTYTDVFGKARETGFFYTVKCRDNVCGCKIGIYEEPRMAIEAWNRRVKDERVD